MAFPENKREIILQEERSIHRISMRRWLASMFEAFELDRGVIYSMRRLIVNPGPMIDDYLYLGRFHYVPPFRLLVVTTAIVLIILNYFDYMDSFFLGMEQGANDMSSEELGTIQRMVQEYFNIILWIYLPIGALFTWLFNRKRAYNFAEHMVYQTYMLSLLNVLFLPLMPVYQLPQGNVIFSVVYLLLILYYYSSSYRYLFCKSWWRSVVETTLIIVLSYAIYFFITVLGIGLYVALITNT